MKREATSVDTLNDSVNDCAVADEFTRLWVHGSPDLEGFIRAHPELSRAELAAILRVDQQMRWRAGERVPAEDYLRRLAEFPPDSDTIVALIFREYRLRMQLGERPDPQELFARFPEHAPVLHAQIELHDATMKSADTVAPGVDPHATNTGAGHPPNDADEAAMPRTIGRYEIVRSLGTGAMGAVYLARDTALERLVALKVPRLGRDRPGLSQRFRREAIAAAALHHPNLCPVFDVGSADGYDYFAMHYVPGESLGARLKRAGPLTTREALELTIQIGDAMAVAHEAGVIHRDLKPGNILFNEQGDPVVVDFGLAHRAATKDAKLTEPGAILGTPAYMPPEQVGCDPTTLGPSSDIYSLGVILYELLTGQVPFQGPTPEVLRQLLTEEPISPARFRPGLDPRLVAAIQRCMAKQPSERFSSMAEFSAALRHIIATPYQASNHVRAPIQSPNSQQTKRWWIGGIACVLVLVVGLVIWQWKGRTVVTSQGDDPFVVGNVWSGHFTYLPAKDNYSGTVVLTITRRAGTRFEATYLTEGMYQWEVEGEARDGIARWKLMKPANPATQALPPNSAEVSGSYRWGEFVGTYNDRDSQAKLELQLQQ